MSLQGKVKFFNHTKGYGFLEMDDGKNVFVHARAVVGNPLQEGDQVYFDTEYDEMKGKEAASNVSGGTGDESLKDKGKGDFGGGKDFGGKGKGFGKDKGKGKGFSKGKGKSDGPYGGGKGYGGGDGGYGGGGGGYGGAAAGGYGGGDGGYGGGGYQPAY